MVITMLKLVNVSKYYYSNETIALGLRKVDLEFRIGEFVAITGESGSGKSTLLNVLSGLDTYESGKMYINNEDISHYTVKELENYRRQYIGFVFQNYNIVDSYSVLQNVEMALVIQGFNKEKRRKRAIELIEKVGLQNRINHKASKLSGGEKQRTVIARALAKDCQIIVCDEPTGNLDSTSAKKIFELLSEISKDKLVIVVTHNFKAIKDYANRKIRLFDGEIVEDKTLHKMNAKEDQKVLEKQYYSNYFDVLKIAINNILSVPKKTIFTTLVTLFIIGVFVFGYGSSLKQKNTSTVFETAYFSNSNSSRLILTKYDQSGFSEEELADLLDIEYVRDVINYDASLDTILTSQYYNEEFDYDEFIQYKVLTSASLNLFDLKSGRLPKNDNEVVIAENKYYQLGDNISLSNSIHVKEQPGEKTTDYTFKIVGIIERSNSLFDETENLFFTSGAIEHFKYDALFPHNQMYIDVDSLKTYIIYQDVRIDNGLADFTLLGYDAMFYDMCRDFGIEVCEIPAFISQHDFSIMSISRFEDSAEYLDIIFTSVPYVEGAYGQAIYMNETTFEYLLEEDIFQPSVVVYDMYEAQKVKVILEDLGYNVFYPNGIVDTEGGLLLIFNNVKLFLSLTLMMIVVYFVGYFVMRNVMISKKKDYLIYRSVGASKKIINLISITEIMMITIASFVLIMGVLTINEDYKTPLPRYLRYFDLNNYLTLLITIFVLMLLMGRRFNKQIFNKSVITSLRDMV